MPHMIRSLRFARIVAGLGWCLISPLHAQTAPGPLHVVRIGEGSTTTVVLPIGELVGWIPRDGRKVFHQIKSMSVEG